MMDIFARNGSSRFLGRREFLSRLGATTVGAVGLGMISPFEFAKDAMAAEPSLKITSIDVASYSTNFLNGTGYLVRVNTNKGITGYGEIRTEDGTQGLTELTNMWPTLKGMNPTQVENVFNAIKNTGNPFATGSTTVNQCALTDIPRHAGAMCAVECACWDILGKVHNVPIWKLLGPKHRDSMRMYCDTSMQGDQNTLNTRIDTRVSMGFTWYKHDLECNNGAWTPGGNLASGTDWTTTADSNFSYPYTVTHITSSGMAKLLSYSQAYRTRLLSHGTTPGGFDLSKAPISSDHNTGWVGPNYLDVSSANLWTKTMYDTSAQGPWGGWHEDIVPWWYSTGFNPSLNILDAIHSNNDSGIPVLKPNGTATPILTGEDMFSFTEYKAMIDAGSVDYIHPDPASSGGVNNCRMAAMYAASKGIRTALHNSNMPFATAMCCHIAAGIPEPYFAACELHYPDDYAKWQAISVPQLTFVNGCIPIPMEPGLGVRPTAGTAFTAKNLT